MRGYKAPPFERPDMTNRVVIITGAARGIGRACASRFLKDGYNVVIADRDEAAAQDAMRSFGLGHERVISVQCDVSDKLAIHNLIAETLSAFGQIDVLINNAAITKKGGALDLSIEDFDTVLAINLRGAFLAAKGVASYMADALRSNDDRSGAVSPNFSIINVSSINDKLAMADYLAYAVSKGGLAQLTKSMSIELAPLGIRVNTISPGSVKTDMLSSVVGDDELSLIHARTPLGRIAHPDEISGVAAFLAGPDASYITGETIYVDGGRAALNYVMPAKE